MKVCPISAPNTKRTSHQTLTSKAGCPSPATHRDRVPYRTDALSEAADAIFHRPISRGATDPSTLPGVPLTPPRGPTTPPSYTNPSTHARHRTSKAPCLWDPPSALRWMRHRSSACPVQLALAPKRCPQEGQTASKVPSSSDPVDPDLGFPPELPDQVDVTYNDEASRRKRRLRRRHRPPRPQSGAIFTGSHVLPISWLAGTERNLATKTYVAVGTPAEIRHLLTGPSTRRWSAKGLPATDPNGALDPQ